MEIMKFIRLDVKGTWMGAEHVSSTESGPSHAGISCYRLDDPVGGLESLWWYWVEYVNTWFRPSDYADKQITIFEGVLVGQGPDMEDLAKCYRTIAEFDALPFMEKIQSLKERLWDEEITSEEYNEELKKLLQGVIA